MSDDRLDFQEDTESKTREKITTPSLYRVFILNDDYTTMDFVVMVLEQIFHKSKAEATRIMLHVHKKGMGLCGVFTKEIAETKMARVHDAARKNSFPLRCIMEKE